VEGGGKISGLVFKPPKFRGLAGHTGLLPDGGITSHEAEGKKGVFV